ncbi:MAG: MerR family transcriptional regulator [Microbacterium enclense]
MTTTWTPAEAAARTHLSLDTLRYYEREGLIGHVARTAGGHRAYTEHDLFWIGLITCLRDAGLGIADLREFTVLLREDDAGDRVAFLTAHREELENRRHKLERAIEVLDEKIAHYSGS